MYHIQNFTDNDDIKLLDNQGAFTVLEFARDLSVTPENAQMAYFAQSMNVRKRQLLCNLSESPVTVQSGAMQWMVGDVQATTGIKGVGDLVGKAFRGKASGEGAIKPEYQGTGELVLEPTYKHLILDNLANWQGKVVLDDGLFMACESSVRHRTVMRSNLSSAVLGGEGLFNLALEGNGNFCLESSVPKEELVEVYLENDTIKFDGNFAIAWSASLEFTVERSGKTLIGSAASGEGLVNVYRGTGKILFAPVQGLAFPISNLGGIS